MKIRKISLILLSITILFSSKTHLIVSDDTITSTQSLTGNSTIISKQGNFELGFFTPGNSRNYYIGIWYKKVSVRTVVWVANRDKPLRDPLSSEFKLLENGNLVVFDQSKIPIWSTGSTSSTSSSYEALLGDDGNLVVRGVLNKAEVIWQSFDNPTDTWLPGAKLAFHGNSNKLQTLASWKNEEDPGYGIYSIGLDSGGTDQFVMKSNRNQTYWKTGTWDGQFFSSLPEIRINYVFKFKFVLINDQEWYFTYTIYNDSIYYRLVMDLSGKFLQYAWSNSTQQWSQPRYQCDVYGICGNCDQKCSCLAGSKDRSSNIGNSYDGCVRRTPLQCENRDGFYRIANMSTPSSNDTLVVGNADDCKLACTKNCTCSAYAYGIHGCSLWYGDVSNMKESADSGVDIYLKLGGTNNTASTNQIEKDPKPNSKDSQRKKEHNSEVIIIPTVLVGALIMSFFLYFSWRWILKQRGNRTKESDVTSSHMHNIDQKVLGDNQDKKIFQLEELERATNNFSEANKLGRGGFGPVYKGILSDGQEIAVKRLSKTSTQGLQEFKNEVLVILKLQHRNLVRLLGCCIEGEEKMLIYEYLPNKSLDFFLFDSSKLTILDWGKRFQIIEGICRGVLYLHRDSRLRVIHRDLKASNVLLDEDLNPKISDFGMAKIFGGNELQANTLRIVGTYGYMSPEYAMEGRFSEKSDVFSFGVLLLEIVSGRRINSFYHMDEPLSLLGYAWKLWKENKILSFIDSTLSTGPNLEGEIIRCIQVGLLCVQDFVDDRPSMSTTLSMLTGEIATLPTPKRPAFNQIETSSESSLSQQTHRNYSVNNVTITDVKGR